MKKAVKNSGQQKTLNEITNMSGGDSTRKSIINRSRSNLF